MMISLAAVVGFLGIVDAKLAIGDGWNIYFSNENTAQIFEIYAFQQPVGEFKQSTLGAAWQVVDLPAGIKRRGPVSLPIDIELEMVDQLPIYDDITLPYELQNYGAPHGLLRNTPVNTYSVPMGSHAKYDQNFEKQNSGVYSPSFVNYCCGQSAPGTVLIENVASHEADSDMKNQYTQLRVYKNGKLLMENAPLKAVGCGNERTYKGGLGPGFQGELRIEDKLYVGLTSGDFTQGKTYSYSQLSTNIAELPLPNLPQTNDVEIILSNTNPPTISIVPIFDL